MLSIITQGPNHIVLNGRFDASQVNKAKNVFDKITASCSVDFNGLEYISSAGLSVLLITQKRLDDIGQELTLLNLNQHIREIFRYAGFDKIFKIK